MLRQTFLCSDYCVKTKFSIFSYLYNVHVQEILDEEEQDAVILSLQKDVDALGSKMLRFGRFIGYVLTLIYLNFAVVQMIRPWSVVHQKIFRNVLSVESLALGELSSCLCLGAATFSFVQFLKPITNSITWKNLLTLSVTFCVLQITYWGMALYSLVSLQDAEIMPHVWRVVWKPAVPLMWFAAVVIMIDNVSKLQIQLGELKAVRYRLKNA